MLVNVYQKLSLLYDPGGANRSRALRVGSKQPEALQSGRKKFRKLASPPTHPDADALLIRAASDVAAHDSRAELSVDDDADIFNYLSQ